MNQYSLGTASDVFHNQYIYWLAASFQLQTNVNNSPIHGYSIEVLDPLDPTRVMTIQLQEDGQSSEVFHSNYRFGQRLNSVNYDYHYAITSKMKGLGFFASIVRVMDKLKEVLEMHPDYPLIPYCSTGTMVAFIGLLKNGDCITISFKNNPQ